MKRYFENLAIDCWLYTNSPLGGRQPCICMRANTDGASHFMMAINELSREGAPSSRKLTFQSTKSGAFHSIRICFSPASTDLRMFSIRINNDMPVFEFTPSALPEIKSAIESWIGGGEDFCLFPRGKKSELGKMDKCSGDLWFWVIMPD